MPAPDRTFRTTLSGAASAFRRYTVAVVAVAAGFALRVGLEAWVGPGLPAFITFYPPVVVATLLGGIGPGLLATAVAAVIADIWIFPPIGQLAIASPVDRLATALFCGMGFLLIAVAELSRRNRAKAVAFDRIEAVQASEQRYRLLVEQAMDGIFVADAAGRYIDVNTAGAAMLGYTPDEICRLTIADLLDPAELARVPDPMSQFANGTVVRNEWQFRRKDGSIFTGELVGRQLPDGCLQGIVRDITERKQTEKALRESEARLQSEAAALARLNEASSRLWAIRDLRMGLDEVLAAAIDLLGADMGHVQLFDAERGVLEIAVQRGFKQDFLDVFREVPANQDTSSGRALRSCERIVIEDVETDSSVAPYRPLVACAAGYRAVQSTPLIGRDGTPLGMISTHFRSVHRSSEEELGRFDLYVRQAAGFIERHRMDEALRESESLYRAIGESIDYGIWICDTQGRNIYASESLLKLVGITQDQCKDFGWGNVLHPDDAEATIAAWKHCIQIGAPWYREHRYLGTDGQYHPILACGVPVRDARGQITQWAGINLDISRLKQAEEALRASEERLRTFQAEIFHASRLSEIGKMAAAIAHEINQPLAAVASYIGGCRRILASITEDEQSKRKVQETMEKASVQALRAGEIIRRLREFIGSGQRDRRIEDAGSLLREACTLAITLAKHDGISIRSDIRQSGHVLCDKIQFQQVIINLARNAVEAMENSRRKELEFGLAKNGNNIEVSVSDTGPGIAPEIVDRLFKPFVTTRTGGMGIGLSVCREIVEAHDGKIWYEPSPNGGTVFRFTLPIVAEDMVA